MTPFGEILKRTVEETPGAVGGAFADGDGEMVDSFATGVAATDWAILTAHYGVILSHLHATFGLWHFGGPEYFVARHSKMDIVVHALADGYFALLALRRVDDPERPRGSEKMPTEDVAQNALASLRVAAVELAREMA